MKLLIVDDQSTVVQGLLHCTNWAAMGFTVVDTALNAVDAKASLLGQVRSQDEDRAAFRRLYGFLDVLQ